MCYNIISIIKYERLNNLMRKERYIGLMSGTSLDGVDVALCEISKEECKLVSSVEFPIPDPLKDEILHTISSDTTLAKVGELDKRLGELFSDAVLHLLNTCKIDPQSITAIGSHGQTLWHDPNNQTPFTMQMGDASTIAARTRIPVVADFRSKDVALGGQGAPLAPAFHQFLFQEVSKSVAVVNIGGIANITVPGRKLLGYDTGPGNMLMDMWIQKHKEQSYDNNGEWARSGSVNYTLLDKMLEDDYFTQEYPKSTGREKFNDAWVQSVLSIEMKSEDVQRTLLELTAVTISNEVLKFQRDILVLCGGGALNELLVERIKALMPNLTVIIAEDAMMMEAMMMAWLAYKRIHNEHVILRDVTGASENAVLGGIYA